MRKSDIPRAWALNVGMAFALLTRLPLPRLPDDAFDRQADAVWAFPVVGLAIGGMAGMIGVAALALGLPASVSAGLILAIQIGVTGAMHEDGLADTVDGLWGGWTRERRLEIMKDSAIGTYGVLALILSVGLRWMALAALLPLGIWPVIAAAALPRSLLPPLMAGLPHARDDGLSRRVGAPARGPVAMALMFGLAIGWFAVGPAIVGAWLLAVALVLALALLARSRIGGQTGDILGAAEQLGEIAVLLTLLAFAAS
ncbi:adenosylcobinamide-GDP ribazoletransferase [Sedimentitalea todarodis]|uniref:Adenosylcobinamide-GDP ribazoletransferase n=1 Tax=Sedimentitalea todarodis TaxID=1631240 RepID=A0ABU3V980_9RHOB|nr:adenosylcobinamide-GDP ribazoletransferase [Sedimentitalea todarodis]MDU9002717.1 adenosylcobinamide-GDP ribazoletransferase [Sedimentitalea todarodis]